MSNTNQRFTLFCRNNGGNCSILEKGSVWTVTSQTVLTLLGTLLDVRRPYALPGDMHVRNALTTETIKTEIAKHGWGQEQNGDEQQLLPQRVQGVEHQQQLQWLIQNAWLHEKANEKRAFFFFHAASKLLSPTVSQTMLASAAAEGGSKEFLRFIRPLTRSEGDFMCHSLTCSAKSDEICFLCQK